MPKTTEELIAEYQSRGRRIRSVKPGRHGRIKPLNQPTESKTTWDFGRTDDPKSDQQRFGKIVERDWEPKQRSYFYE